MHSQGPTEPAAELDAIADFEKEQFTSNHARFRFYSRFILPFFTPLSFPAANPPEPGSIFPEALTPDQKDDLIAFLQVL